MERIERINERQIPTSFNQLGGFNDFPPNWEELSEAEFSHSRFFIYSPTYRDFRQMIRRNGKPAPFIEANLYIYNDGSGYAISADRKQGKVRYYKFAVCEHDYEVQHGRKYEHIYTCKKCGHSYIQDSSDCHSYS